MTLAGITLIILAVACFLRTREPPEMFAGYQVGLGYLGATVLGIVFLVGGVVLIAIGSN